MFVLVKFTDSCNMNCRYCCMGNHDSSTMPLSDAKLAIDSILDFLRTNDFQENDICFHGGEPSLLPVTYLATLWDRIKASMMDVTISMQTNMYAMSEELLQLAKHFDVRLSTSVDGPESIHDKSRIDKNGRGTFSRVVANLKRCQDLGVRVGVICTLNKYNCTVPRELYAFFKKLGVPYKINWVHKIGKGVNPLINLSSREVAVTLMELLDAFLADGEPSVFDDTSTEFMTGVMSGKMLSCAMQGHCQKEFICIESNGDVYPCDAFSYLPNAKQYCYGNILRDGIGVFEHSKRCELQSRDICAIDGCLTCENATICNGGCLLDAENGDYRYGKSIFCDVYKKVFSHCREIKQLMAESTTTENKGDD